MKNNGKKTDYLMRNRYFTLEYQTLDTYKKILDLLHSIFFIIPIVTTNEKTCNQFLNFRNKY